MNLGSLFKYELYKLAKSRIMRFLCILIVLSDVVSTGYRVSDSILCRYVTIKGVNFFLIALIIVFVNEDFSSGYIKNIYPVINKAYYILIKLFFIFLFCLIAQIIWFLLIVLFNMTSKNHKQWLSPYELEESSLWISKTLIVFACKIAGGVAGGLLIALFTLIIKNAFISLVAVWSYLLFVGTNALQALLDKTFLHKIMPATHYLISPFLDNQTNNEYLKISFLIMLAYTIIFNVIGWIVFSKRKVE